MVLVNMIDKKLLDILACPVCKGDIFEDKDELVCVKCKRRYPVREGIPIMLEEEARIE
ncbi:MAG: hypothetical protein AMQ22_02271 [Candidatus Methanofastidiosum methylothiophilum]|uniref:UPF0434 protein AMQ22_02271 n=1 Tax=Candidatus Methanofastidiosum methylothiophilum TaxID=1705564 RepID=A0A150IIK1_9EURY|nr:MAG: hypothetical protein AMQ22_02271 [Candidatus Methanofastidiosum methylthiophilus]